MNRFVGIFVLALAPMIAPNAWGTVGEPADDEVLEVARIIAGGASAVLTFTNLALSISDDGSTTWGVLGIGVGLATLSFEAASDEVSTLGASVGIAAVASGLVSIACDRLTDREGLSRASLQPSITRRSFGMALSIRF